MKQVEKFHIFLLLLLVPLVGLATNNFQTATEGWHIAGIRVDFYLFVMTLVGIAFFHQRALFIAVTGLVSIFLVRLLSTHFDPVEHLENEWEILLNLFGLLLGFALLAKLFEESGVPDRIPALLPGNWTGPLLLLLLVFFMSSFLDNIAAAMIGGSIAMVIFRQKVHIGYLAAIVAASNAGGAGSVVGDTTTTMMWIDGISPGIIVPAYLAAIPAFLIFGTLASRQQFQLQPVVKVSKEKQHAISWRQLGICLLILAGAISTNILLDFPALGVWVALGIGALLVKMPWQEVKNSLHGTFFLLAVVSCASMMPVEELPPASWQSAFVLGLVSSVFDNIPLTKLALDQSNYDWALLAYAVGFGGSLTWFGSSAGVAITNLFPEGRDLKKWVRSSWYLILAYAIGFLFLFLLMGWHPHNHN
jgi:Na+/H+ antiporter NhaD/arsenite permease-like protein